MLVFMVERVISNISQGQTLIILFSLTLTAKEDALIAINML